MQVSFLLLVGNHAHEAGAFVQELHALHGIAREVSLANGEIEHVPPRSGCPAQFLADHPPQRFLEGGLLRALDIGAQRIVDQCLIVAAAGALHQVSKIVQDVGVQADRDALLAGSGTTGPRFPWLKS